ncbi:DNA repair protein RecO [bacterium HR37]|nr:DNA repair protein RecO [bacterium HR37]
MQTSEAFVLRKNLYSEADYIVSFLTVDFGKIQGIAKNAKRSRKRFGGRLEPFIHLRIRFREGYSGIKFIEDAETVQVFTHIMEDINLFMWASFVLENTDILIPDEEPVKDIFHLLLETLSFMNSGIDPALLTLEFQIKALSFAGYKPSLYTCLRCNRETKGKAFFHIQKGGIICTKCAPDEQKPDPLLGEFVINEGLADINQETTLNNIKTLSKFTEYHTGKKIKSYRFIEELKI